MKEIVRYKLFMIYCLSLLVVYEFIE